MCKYINLGETNLEAANKAVVAEVEKLIPKATKMPETNGMCPSIFVAMTLNGQYHVGINYQPKGTAVGHQYHYDHGVGIERNSDATVHWIKAA